MPSASSCLVSLLVLSSAASAQMTEAERVEMPGQIVVCFESGAGAVDLEAQAVSWGLSQVDSSVSIDGIRSLMRWQRRGETVFSNVTVLEVSGTNIDEAALRQRISSMPGVRWAAPNVGYVGNVKELVPNDA